MCKITAIVLSAGKGKRMNSNIPKQYMLINNKPILFYSLKVFQENKNIDDIILVSGKEDVIYCKEEIVEKYNFTKVKNIIEGGKERYNSVYNALMYIENTNYVFIHDGARPFINDDIINRAIEKVKLYKACIVGVPSKDTIKIVDDNKTIINTPNRKNTWIIQTPQCFEFNLIKKAYNIFMKKEDNTITDDAMVLEKTLNYNNIKIVNGDYKNIKITTPEDISLAELFLKLV